MDLRLGCSHNSAGRGVLFAIVRMCLCMCMRVYFNILYYYIFLICHIYVLFFLFFTYIAHYCHSVYIIFYIFLLPTAAGWLEEISVRDKSTFVNLISVILFSLFILFLVQ